MSDNKFSLQTAMSFEKKYFWVNTQTCRHFQGDFLGGECRSKDSMKQGLRYQAEIKLNTVIECSRARLEVGTADKKWKKWKKWLSKQDATTASFYYLRGPIVNILTLDILSAAAKEELEMDGFMN